MTTNQYNTARTSLETKLQTMHIARNNSDSLQTRVELAHQIVCVHRSLILLKQMYAN